MLRKLANASGEKVSFPKSLQEITPICDQIAREIRDQYVITFVPTRKSEDGRFRALVVRARETPKGRRLNVATRPGYLAPKAPIVSRDKATMP